MKKILLLLAVVLSGLSNAQTVAIQPPSLSQCNNEVFDLNVQTVIILGAQDPQFFSVTYYTTAADAEDATNPIQQPSFFVSPQVQTIFARVDSLTDDTYAITQFELSWGNVMVQELPDVTACAGWTVPILTLGQIRTAPGGGGMLIAPGTLITTTQTLYTYNQVGNCWAESSFTVTIGSVSGSLNAQTLFACAVDNSGSAVFNLTNTIPFFSMGNTNTAVTFHLTQADAQSGENPILNPSSFATTTPGFQTIFVRTVAPTQNNDCVMVNTQPLVVQPCTENSVSVSLRADYEGTGCNGPTTPVAGVMVTLIAGNAVSYGITDAEGSVTFINLPPGPVTVMAMQNPNGLTLSGQDSYTIFLEPTSGGNYQFSFCYAPVAPVHDVQVSVYPLGAARPGFPATYGLILTNLGNVTSSGTVNLQFDSTRLSFVNASPTPATVAADSLTFSFQNLAPWQYNYLTATFLVATPPVADLGDLLQFTATITPTQTDDYPANNVMSFAQPVVNSFDPNDIVVLEGAVIPQEQADDWLHYIVRFENVGTAEAIHVRVENPLSDLLDWGTLQVDGSSHPVVTTRQNDLITFRFDDINLPATAQDSFASHGWIAYRIKPGPNFILGTTIENNASIFFDFNAPIQTNTVTTELAPLSIVTPGNSDFQLYPNPAIDFVRIVTKSPSKVTVYDLAGRLLPLPVVANGNEIRLDVSALPSGIYTLKFSSGTDTFIRKLLKK